MQVSTAAQLAYIDDPHNQSQYLSANIELMNSIDLSGYPWVPFGGNVLAPYSGTFNGQGHQITGLNINDTTNQYIGFFGETSGTIENLGVVTAAVNEGITAAVYGGDDTGVLVGQQDSGTIIDTYAAGSVSGGAADIGGLVGRQNAGSLISGSYATASVAGMVDANIGGLVGVSLGDIRNSYALGAVSGDGSDGGFVGYGSGTISDCYAAGPVSGGALNGSFAARDEGTITGSFADTTVNNPDAMHTVGVTLVDTATVTGLPTSSMIQASTFTGAGWDFNATWSISTNINFGYPYLQSGLSTSLTPAATDVSSNQSVSVTGSVYYGGMPVNALVSLAADSGTWSNGLVTDAVYADETGQYSTMWTAPTVTIPSPVTITAAVYGAPSVQARSTVTVEPPVPGVPSNMQHSDVTSSGWTETWGFVPYATSYNVYLNGSKIGSTTSPTYTFYGEQPGTHYTVAVTAVNSVGRESGSAADTVTTGVVFTPVPPPPVTVPPPVPPVIITKSLNQSAQVGRPYSVQIQESGGTGPFQWAIADGTLPLGLKIDNNGVISGTPSGHYSQFTFTVQVTDANHLSASQAFTLDLDESTPTPHIYIPLKYAVFSGIKGPNQFGPHSFDIESLSYVLSSSSTTGATQSSAASVISAGVPIGFDKAIDLATPQLMAYAATGKVFVGDFYLQKLVNGHYDCYFQLHFVGRISDDRQAASSDGSDVIGTETITIVPLAETVTFTQILPDGSLGAQSKRQWSATKNH